VGLAAVAVSPSHRRRRVAGRLVTSGLRHARERGDLVSALYPFRIRFYEELGYGLAGEAHQYLLPPEQFPDSAERLRIELVRGDDDHQTIRALYDRWAPSQNGQLVRHDGHWQRLWEGERAGVVYRGEGGEPEGYAVVRYRADLPPAERFLEVEERVWLTPAARRGIYAWLASLGDQWRLLTYRAHPEEGFAEVVREPRLPLAGGPPHWGLWFPSATLMAGPMFRLLDVGRAWEQRRAEPSAATTLGLEVQDEQVPENAGSWRLRLEDGRVGVERSGGGGVDVSLRLPVRVLSRLFIGALTPTVAVDAGLAETDRPDRLAALDAALRLPRPWTFDRF
jgi:predicted acetyltransferase